MVLLLIPQHHVLLMIMTACDQKIAVPHFYHFDIRNGMVQLMMPSVSGDTDTSANGITLPN